MNKNINLVEILKDCPKGTKLYSTIFGEVEFVRVYQNNSVDFIIEIKLSDNSIDSVTADGRYCLDFDGECTIFPSKDQRDWRRFKAPWCKKERFDPKTLQPFDKVLVKDRYSQCWRCNLFSHTETEYPMFRVNTILVGHFYYCIPYNEDTKHLVGTTEEAPEYYRYWED